MDKNFKKKNRETNIPQNSQARNKNLNKVTNQVFVFTKSLTVGELAKLIIILTMIQSEKSALNLVLTSRKKKSSMKKILKN